MGYIADYLNGLTAGTELDEVLVALQNFMNVGPRGDCYLAISAGNLLLLPEKGNKLWIGSRHFTIPAAGVSLVPTGLVTGTAYFIYAYISGTTLTLEPSTTGPEVNTTTGVKQKTGDATRTLVGLWIATGAALWSTVPCQGASWYNPRAKTGASAVVNQAITSAPVIELNASLRLDFVNFSGRMPRAEVAGRVGVSVVSSDASLDIGLDGTTAQLASAVTVRNGDTVGNDQTPLFGGRSLPAVSEGKHYITALASISTGTGTFNGMYTQVTIEG